MSVAYWSVLLCLCVIYLPRALVARGQRQAPEGYDNHHPRDQQTRLDAVARRANAAHQNAFEAFAPFAAAVLVTGQVKAAGHHVDDSLVGGLAAGHLAARVLYVVLYVTDRSTMRSVVWTAGFLAVLGLFGVALAAL